MMAIPEYAKPAVGWAMYHLDRDEVPERVWIMLAAHRDYGSFSEELRQRVLCQALRNLAASDAYRLQPKPTTLQKCLDWCDCDEEMA